MENAKIIEQLREVIGRLRDTSTTVVTYALAKRGETLLDALAKSIELAPSSD